MRSDHLFWGLTTGTQEKFFSALSQISASTTSATSLFSALTEIYIFSFGSVPDGRTTIEQ